MTRFTTHALLSSLCLAVSATASAQLTVVEDYTFDDATALDPFFQTGTPTVVGGELVLDGGSYLEIDDPLGGAVDNYVIEVILTADSFDAFDFAFARNDPLGDNGGNNGQGLLLQDFGGGAGQIGALNSSSGFSHGATAGTDPVQLATGVPTYIAIAQVSGITHVFTGGRSLLDTIDAATNPIIGVPNNLGIGTHPFDAELGAFNGSIDRVRISTFADGTFDPADLIEPSVFTDPPPPVPLRDPNAVLALDFQGDPAEPGLSGVAAVTADDFTAFNVPTLTASPANNAITDPSITEDGITFAIDGTVGGFGSAGAGNDALDQDFLFLGGFLGYDDSIGWTLSGLAPNTEYDLIWHSGIEGANDRSTEIASGGLTGNVVTDEDDLVLTLTSDGSGVITGTATRNGTSGESNLAGLQVVLVGGGFDPADLDQDGDVDDADFGIAFAAFTGPNNGPSNNPDADLDGDDDVDDADFGIAFSAFTGPGGAANVPEPASLALLAIGGAMALRRRR